MAEPQQPQKEQNPQSEWNYQSDQKQDYVGDQLGQNVNSTAQNVPSVQWSASEYIDSEKNNRWYLALFGASVLLVLIVFAITRDYFASFVVLLASTAMSVFAGRKPDTKQYIVDENGITVDDKTYPYAEFRSFSIVEEGAIDSIWLKPLKRFSPMVVMYYAPDEEEKIVKVISNFLPHEQRELDAIDKFSKRIRF